LPYYSNYPEGISSRTRGRDFNRSFRSAHATREPVSSFRRPSKIAYPLIPGGIFVGGKTVEQVTEEIGKKLDEYIIDPQVTVTLDKVGSARFSVLGKVGTPGDQNDESPVQLFTKRFIEAGGIIKKAIKKGSCWCG
jgi:hypothetical protein